MVFGVHCILTDYCVLLGEPSNVLQNMKPNPNKHKRPKEGVSSVAESR